MPVTTNEVSSFIWALITISGPDSFERKAMYRELMSIHGASQKDGEYIHASRLNEFNLENVSTLCESKTRKHIVLTLRDDMGQYLF